MPGGSSPLCSKFVWTLSSRLLSERFLFRIVSETRIMRHRSTTEILEESTSIRAPTNMLDELRETLYEERLSIGFGRYSDSNFRDAISHPRVRELLEWETPEVTDLSDLLKMENNGRVRAVRMDLFAGVGNLKKPVVAGLILKGVMGGRILRDRIDTLIDAGNMNTGFATKYYCRKCGLSGFYIMSRYFPKDMLEILQDNTFQVVQAPAQDGMGKEEEFYGHLFVLMKDSKFRRNKHCLWHAKYGGAVLYPLGMEIATSLEQAPDYIVVSVGAGSTLECLSAVLDYYSEKSGKKSKIVVPEHAKSPIYSKVRPAKHSTGPPVAVEESNCMHTFDPGAFRRPPSKSIPHPVIGPHYDKPNPLLSKNVINRIGYVQQYSDDEWMKMSHYLESHGLGVGNSSAANVSVASNLANQGYDVLTVVLEPMRSYYKASVSYDQIPRELGSLLRKSKEALLEKI